MKPANTLKKNLIKYLPLSFVAFLTSLPLFAQFEPIGAELEYMEALKNTKMTEFFSFQIDRFDSVFFVRMLIDVLSMIILIRLIYYKVYRRHDYFFTFFMFNLIIFIITFLMNSTSGMSLGAAFGLFAIFAMLRYRTEDISARDMTYLFMSITIGLISSINMGSVFEITIINGVILLVAFLIEGNVLIKQSFSKSIEYERVELIKPESREELIADLKEKTGLDIHKVMVKRIDFLRDTAILKVYYTNVSNQDL